MICIDARIADKALSAKLNKSDSTDAEGLAQLAWTGWFTPVHIRSEASDRLRTLIGARERLIRLRKDLEGNVRGVLKTFGIRMTGVSKGRNRDSFREQLAAAGDTDRVQSLTKPQTENPKRESRIFGLDRFCLVVRRQRL